jgi:hypothetical protein
MARRRDMLPSMGFPDGYVGTCRGTVLHHVDHNTLFHRCSTYMYALLWLLWKTLAVTSKSMARAS